MSFIAPPCWLTFILEPETPADWRLPAKMWTTMPCVELGDIPYEKAPVRSVHVLEYDGDKYCTVVFELKHIALVKAGYLHFYKRDADAQNARLDFDDVEKNNG